MPPTTVQTSVGAGTRAVKGEVTVAAPGPTGGAPEDVVGSKRGSSSSSSSTTTSSSSSSSVRRGKAREAAGAGGLDGVEAPSFPSPSTYPSSKSGNGSLVDVERYYDEGGRNGGGDDDYGQSYDDDDDDDEQRQGRQSRGQRPWSGRGVQPHATAPPPPLPSSAASCASSASSFSSSSSSVAAASSSSSSAASSLKDICSTCSTTAFGVAAATEMAAALRGASGALSEKDSGGKVRDGLALPRSLLDDDAKTSLVDIDLKNDNDDADDDDDEYHGLNDERKRQPKRYAELVGDRWKNGGGGGGGRFGRRRSRTFSESSVASSTASGSTLASTASAPMPTLIGWGGVGGKSGATSTTAKKKHGRDLQRRGWGRRRGRGNVESVRRRSGGSALARAVSSLFGVDETAETAVRDKDRRRRGSVGSVGGRRGAGTGTFGNENGGGGNDSDRRRSVGFEGSGSGSGSGSIGGEYDDYGDAFDANLDMDEEEWGHGSTWVGAGGGGGLGLDLGLGVGLSGAMAGMGGVVGVGVGVGVGGLDSVVTSGQNYGIQDDYEADDLLPDGPLRFAPRGERPVGAQILSLSLEERACFDELRRRWDDHLLQSAASVSASAPASSSSTSASADGIACVSLSDEMVLRFARCCPGPRRFDVESAWRTMRRYDPRHMGLTAVDVEDHLRTGAFVVCPNLRTVDGYEVLYMNPSKYPAREDVDVGNGGGGGSPSGNGTAAARISKSAETTDAAFHKESALDDALVYCVDSMLRTERNSTCGIALLADMTDWEYSSNFSMNYFHRLVLLLQGRIPVRIRTFLLVNPPAWFRTAWAFVRPLLKEELRDTIQMVSVPKEDEVDDDYDYDIDDVDVDIGRGTNRKRGKEGRNSLGRYLARGYREFLPDDTVGGRADTVQLVEDFLTYRRHVEGAL